MASDEHLVFAFDPAFEGMTPREVLEQLVANDVRAWWRLRSRTLSAEQYEETWHSEGYGMGGPGEWRISLVLRFLLEISLGERVLTSTVLERLAERLMVAAREVARAEEWAA